MSKLDGVEDFFSGVSETAPELTMTIHAAEANRVGLTPEQVAASVNGALLGVEAGQVRLQDRSIGVRVRAPDQVRMDALQPLRVMFMTGEMERGDFKLMTRLQTRTAERLLRGLFDLRLVVSDSLKGKLRFGVPLHALRFYFPALWPEAEGSAVR